MMDVFSLLVTAMSRPREHNNWGVLGFNQIKKSPAEACDSHTARRKNELHSLRWLDHDYSAISRIKEPAIANVAGVSSMLAFFSSSLHAPPISFRLSRTLFRSEDTGPSHL